MIRLLLALALAIVIASPASAGGLTKKKAGAKHFQAQTQQKLARKSRPAKEGKTVYDETTLNPDLWEPCDYATGWKTNSCGGGG